MRRYAWWDWAVRSGMTPPAAPPCRSRWRERPRAGPSRADLGPRPGPAAVHRRARAAAGRASARRAVYQADAMIWSSPTYHGSVSGSFKNALDWLILLAENAPAVPVEQADRPGHHGGRGAGAAGGQHDGLHRPGAARLERAARPAGGRSRGSRSTRTGISKDEAVAAQLRSSARRWCAPPASSRPRAPATTPKVPVSGLQWRRPWTVSKAVEYR